MTLTRDSISPPSSTSMTLQGMPGITLAAASGSQVFITLQGAQAVSWRTADGRERLYLSPLSTGAGTAAETSLPSPPMRGGVPVCFPQFSGRGPLVKHGFARSRHWTLRNAESSSPNAAENGSAVFLLCDDDETRKLWPHAFSAEVNVAVEADRLIVTLSVTNRGNTAWGFTAALHTYLRVGDIGKTALSGLRQARYEDATDGNVEKTQQEEELRIEGELDRVYLSQPRQLVLLENGMPTMRIEQQGFEDTVVWNPGLEKARALVDLPDDGWREMLCVEAACVATPIVLQPGASWCGSQILTAS